MIRFTKLALIALVTISAGRSTDALLSNPVGSSASTE